MNEMNEKFLILCFAAFDLLKAHIQKYLISPGLYVLVNDR